METKRFQLDLSIHEHEEMERLMARAGLKTKREFVSNALTLFRWAANELVQGRSIGSVDAGGDVKQLEMPALAAFASVGSKFDELLANHLKNRDESITPRLREREGLSSSPSSDG